MKPTEIYALVLGILLIIEPFVLRSNFLSSDTWAWFFLGVVGIIAFIIDKRKKSL